jgi:hypothetical protein
LVNAFVLALLTLRTLKLSGASREWTRREEGGKNEGGFGETEGEASEEGRRCGGDGDDVGEEDKSGGRAETKGRRRIGEGRKREKQSQSTDSCLDQHDTFEKKRTMRRTGRSWREGGTGQR